MVAAGASLAAMSGGNVAMAAGCVTGLERVVGEGFGKYRGMRVGLIANPASVDRGFVHAVERFAASREVKLAAIFGPQHGFKSDQQDNMIESQDEVDPRLGIPVYSLYGEHRKPTAAMLDGLDAVFCDLFDVGVRAYTFQWTMMLAMEACAEQKKKFVVLDRPNPVGGEAVEGHVLDEGFRSFIGLHALPMRHGLTIGELATLLNKERGIGADLDVVEVRGWRRGQWLDETGLPWAMPSPNMATIETAAVYPGTVMVEGTNLSEGRGTVHPFEIVGAPFIDAHRFADRLNAARFPAVRFRALWFKPTFDKHQGRLCGGVQIHVTDRRAHRPYLTGLTVLAAAREMYPKRFEWRQPPFEYEYKKMPIDILTGSSVVRAEIDKGTAPEAIERMAEAGIAKYAKVRAEYLRYG